MRQLTAIRLLDAEEPSQPLLKAVQDLATGQPNESTYQVNPASFRQVPNAPFSYWVSKKIRRLFKELPPFEGDRRTAKQGLATADDFRFVRIGWETPYRDRNQTWFDFAKGGSYSPFYADIFLKVNWEDDGKELTSFSGSVIRNSDFYFRPGLTWPLRTHAFCPQVLPAGCIFSARGYSIIASVTELPFILGLTSSKTFDFLFKVTLGRFGHPEFVVGVLQKLPFAEEKTSIASPAKLGQSAWSLKCKTDTANLTSHAFYAPALSPGQFDSRRKNSNPSQVPS